MTTLVRVATGLEHDGARVRDLWLRPWTGEDVVALSAGIGAGAAPAMRTSALLGRCLSLDGGASAAGAAVARRLTIGDREALLLHLLRHTRGDRLDLVAECEHCGERLELELRIGDLLVPVEEPCDPQPWTELSGPNGDISVHVRLPTGEDQERVALLATGEAAAAASDLLRACLLEVAAGAPEAALPPELEDALAERLGELDPQAELRLAAACPHCDAGLELFLDAGELVHAQIDAASERLLREVHLLALYYHWSEAEILAMEVGRRHRYLELVSAVGEAP